MSITLQKKVTPQKAGEKSKTIKTIGHYCEKISSEGKNRQYHVKN